MGRTGKNCFLALRAVGLGAGMLLGLVGRPMRQLSLEKRMEKAAPDLARPSGAPAEGAPEEAGAAETVAEAAGGPGGGAESATAGLLECPADAVAPEMDEEKVAQHG